MVAVIFNFKNELQLKYKNDIFRDENALIYNCKSYNLIRDYLCNKEEFIEHYSKETREIILVSKDNKRGIIKIKYEICEPRVAELENLSSYVDILLKNFKDKEYIYLFRDRVVDYMDNNVPEKDRFFIMIKNLPIILKQAEQDFQLYLRKFNFENIKNRFRDDRIKYFDSLDKNLDSIGKQISAVPLSFSAVAFAEYQVKDTFLILILIFLGIFIYSFLSWKMLNLSLFDVIKLEEDLDKEYGKIKNDYQDMLDSLENDFNKVKEKIKNFKCIIFYVKVSLVILLVLLFIFSIYLAFFANPTTKIKEYILTL